ncbi:tellurite resistance TerB family protein [Vreelandella malpeensis]|uniref:Tellurite resistance TerB family protein n=1 Tax=Vreelandella malpeensis TaxID=1172368 RepID=A0ABS8DRD9_9GAMM|nr:tellurite resistance TerB family protein [Halomonas malpeensis]MCB8888784.1 tellurite resistance TerB family protein [Halomonas malpeensis]
MNASHVFKQLMQQYGAEPDAKGVLDDPASKFDRPQEPPSRRLCSTRPRGFDARSALGGGVMALLLGSSPGRKLTGKAVKYGLVASLGVYAWNAWQGSQLRNERRGASEWDEGDARAMGDEHDDTFGGEHQEQHSEALLQAVIMAVRACGESDEQARQSVTQRMNALGADDELNAWVQTQLDAPLDAHSLAQQATSSRAAREIYLVSQVVASEQHASDNGWLDRLAGALGLDHDTVVELERRAARAG